MSDFHLIVGLGNPGREYADTRHNVGFRVVDELARRHGLAFGKPERKSLLASGVILSKKVILAKPQTYMNLSGEAVRALVDFYKIELSRLLVISDDLDIPLGTLRLRKAGGAGGQGGLKSIIQHLGSQDFNRLRFGIGRPPGRMDPKDYVLQAFRGDDAILAAEVVSRAAQAVEAWLTDGIELAMSRYNGGVDETPKPRGSVKRQTGGESMTMELPDEVRALLDGEGRVTRWPSKRSVQLLVLDYLAARIEAGRHYTENEINALLNRWHTFGDPALLRRELFELGKLNRTKDGSTYWATPNTQLL